MLTEQCNKTKTFAVSIAMHDIASIGFSHVDVSVLSLELVQQTIGMLAINQRHASTHLCTGRDL